MSRRGHWNRSGSGVLAYPQAGRFTVHLRVADHAVKAAFPIVWVVNPHIFVIKVDAARNQNKAPRERQDESQLEG
jgi:acetone carboxylase gamma subunit